MSELKIQQSEPPAPALPSSAPTVAESAVTPSRRARGGAAAATKARRGRPSYDDYARRVCEALRYDMVQLEGCTTLAQLPGVQAARRRQRRTFLPVGATIRALFDEAVADVEALATASGDPSLRRVAVFLDIWYRDRGTVARVAEALELSRSRVAHAVQPRALELVARRFLDLAWTAEVSA